MGSCSELTLIKAGYNAYGCATRSVLLHAALLLSTQLTCLLAAFRRTASRLGSPRLQRGGSADPTSQAAAEEEQVVEFKHGFSLEYVIQIVRPGQGPHVMEVHLEGAQLQWPYVMAMDFVWDIANAYKQYFCRPWVAPYPEVRKSLP